MQPLHNVANTYQPHHVGSYNTLAAIMPAHLLPLANWNRPDFLLCCLFSQTFPQGKEGVHWNATMERDSGLFAGVWAVVVLWRKYLGFCFLISFLSRPRLHIYVKDSEVSTTCLSCGNVMGALTSYVHTVWVKFYQFHRWDFSSTVGVWLLISLILELWEAFLDAEAIFLMVPIRYLNFVFPPSSLLTSFL